MQSELGLSGRTWAPSFIRRTRSRKLGGGAEQLLGGLGSEVVDARKDLLCDVLSKEVDQLVDEGVEPNVEDVSPGALAEDGGAPDVPRAYRAHQTREGVQGLDVWSE
ncbi:hypothetical protein OJ252_794 [Cryptosporidium canis]|uniref:Uncharacterized protein n=1 Tax=Cryptosporidium canis TaxID=195482 RepID=A0ABQ8PA81_9CRYT|nr:hypothetical protein OJ252_794 [Cryptosporidium canis]